MLRTSFGVVAVAAMIIATPGRGEAANADENYEAYKRYLLGQWNCVGHRYSPDGEKLDIVGRWTFEKAYHNGISDDFETYTSDGSRYTESGYFSHNKLAGKFDRLVMTSMHSSFHYFSKGWDGQGRWIWNGVNSFDSSPDPIDQVITRETDDVFHAHSKGQWDLSEEDTDVWSDIYDVNCTRIAGKCSYNSDVDDSFRRNEP